MEIYKITRWFYLGWWKHLFRKGDNPGFSSKWKRLWCRVNNHPCGCIWYNAGGMEPDYRCKNCGDEI